MNKKTKVIKFKKLNQNINQTHNYVGFYQQNNSNKKEKTYYPVQNKQITIKPKFINKVQMEEKDLQKELSIKQEQKQTDKNKSQVKKDVLNQKFQTEFYYSDNEEFPLSSFKKKTQSVKLSYPKGYKIGDPVEELRNEIIESLSKSQPIISIQEIFSVPLMRSILGVFQQEQKSINFIPNQEAKGICHYQNYQEKHQESLQFYNHNAQIFNAIQMDEEQMEQNQNWIPQQENFWNTHQQNRINNQNNGYNFNHRNHQQFNNNPRNNNFNVPQNFLPSQSTFFEQLNFDSYSMDFDM